MALERISDILAFVRAADAQSFTVAAEQLGLSRSAVGKCVARLEDQLGVRLLHRTTRSVTLTDEGELFHARCVRILADLEEAELAMASRSEQPRGRLRIDVPVVFGRVHVLPLIHRFMEMWPEITVNLTFTDRFVDLIDEGIDLAVRIGGEDDSRLVGRTLAANRLVTCATPEYLAAHGMPETPADLETHNCLNFNHGGRPIHWRFLAQPKSAGSDEKHATQSVSVRGSLCANNADALRDGALVGHGIVQVARFVVSEDLSARRLQPVLEDYETAGAPIRVVYPTGRHLSPKVRRFIDLMAERWRPVSPWDPAA